MARPSLLVGAVLATLAAGCGGDPPPAAPAAPPPASLPPSAEARPRAPDDEVVARVDGHPVYASCVQAQAGHLGLTVAAALDQCVAFELLAQAAEARGLRRDPDVIDAWRREMVRALIHADLAPLSKPEDLPQEFVAPLLAQRAALLDRPEIRLSYYVLVKVPKGTRPGDPADTAARQAAERIYAELADQEGVLAEELYAAADRHAAGLEVIKSTTPFATAANDDAPVKVAVPPYRDALFAMTEIGRVTGPVQVPWGWQVILWWDVWPPEDLRGSFFEYTRQQYFVVWADKLAASLGLTRWIDEALLATLAEDGP